MDTDATNHERRTDTFVVLRADDATAMLRSTEGQVITLDLREDGPDLVRGEVLDATVETGPMGVTYRLAEVTERRHVDVVDSDLTPTTRSREVAETLTTGDIERYERAGDGEVHVLAVPDPEQAAEDVIGDDATLERAARLGAVRVEVRRGDGMVSVRYLPD
jgi:hypothetical protein